MQETAVILEPRMTKGEKTMAEQTILIAEDDPDIRDGVLDDVTNLISTAASSTTNTGSGSFTSNTTGSGASDLVAGAVESVMPSTSTLLYGLVDGSIGSTLWESVTSSTAGCWWRASRFPPHRPQGQRRRNRWCWR